MQFPTTVVICVNCHGEIIIDNDNKPETFNIPFGMTITNLSSTMPSIQNVMSEIKIKHIHKIINDKCKNIDNIYYVLGFYVGLFLRRFSPPFLYYVFKSFFPKVPIFSPLFTKNETYAFPFQYFNSTSNLTD
jgi:hypothetical protein